MTQYCKLRIALKLLALRKKLCKFNNSDKKRYCERLEKQPLNFFTVYNKYRNLSSFFNSQSAGMERKSTSILSRKASALSCIGKPT